MKQYTIQELIGKKIAVHCEAAGESIKLAQLTGHTEHVPNWEIHRGNTCFTYNTVSGFSELDYFKEEGYKIISSQQVVGDQDEEFKLIKCDKCKLPINPFYFGEEGDQVFCGQCYELLEKEEKELLPECLKDPVDKTAHGSVIEQPIEIMKEFQWFKDQFRFGGDLVSEVLSWLPEGCYTVACAYFILWC